MKVEANKLVTFRLGDDLFAADIFSVERVLRYTAPTSVPDMPAYIEGVIDYEHQTVSGGEAPAAGWYSKLRAGSCPCGGGCLVAGGCGGSGFFRAG